MGGDMLHVHSNIIGKQYLLASLSRFIGLVTIKYVGWGCSHANAAAQVRILDRPPFEYPDQDASYLYILTKVAKMGEKCCVDVGQDPSGEG